jgi:hypothetical protein
VEVREHGLEVRDADLANPMRIRANRAPNAGFPQIFVLDPDRHVIELNAATASG